MEEETTGPSGAGSGWLGARLTEVVPLKADHGRGVNECTARCAQPASTRATYAPLVQQLGVPLHKALVCVEFVDPGVVWRRLETCAAGPLGEKEDESVCLHGRGARILQIVSGKQV